MTSTMTSTTTTTTTTTDARIDAIHAFASEIADEPDVQGMFDAIVRAIAVTDPDAAPQVSIRVAYRNVSRSGSGPEVYRRLRYPGTGESGDDGEWPSAPRMPALGTRARERRVEIKAPVPAGTLVADFERARYKGRGGRCTVSFGLVVDHPVKIVWLDHRTLRKTPHYEVTLPDGSTTLWARRVAS